MTEPVSLEAWADQRVRESAEQPMDFSGLESAPHIAGVLYTAAPGDGISSIVGSSDPAAIGAFMQANDLNGTAIRAGENYIVPEPGSFDAPGTKALGQAGLDADNARATQRAQDRLDRSMTAIGTTMSGFDPLKGLLAVTPAGMGTYAGTATQPAEKTNRFGFEEAGGTAGHLGRFLEGQKGVVQAAQDAGEKLRGAKDGFNTAKGVVTGLKRANLGLAAAEEVLGMAADIKSGVPADVAIPGAVLHGGATLGAGAIGGLIGQAMVPIPGLGYLAGAGGGILASYLADRYLPSREQFGRGLQKAVKTYGEQPYFGML